jgi:hypothetical protein
LSVFKELDENKKGQILKNMSLSRVVEDMPNIKTPAKSKGL